jgi:Ca2+-dependent lipid-binding protein
MSLDQGNLTVTLISASGLKAADKNGSSDPYCVFTVNNVKIYKSQTYKKQLAPVFKNESFVAPIVSRNKAILEVKIFDWDQLGSNTLLAEGPIPIAGLESFAAQELDVPLHGGQLKLRMKWEPQLLARKRAGTSLLGSTTQIFASGTGLAGDVVGMGVGAGGKVLTGGTKVVTGGIGAIGGGIGAIGRGIGKIGGKKSSVVSEPPTNTGAAAVATTTTTTTTSASAPPLTAPVPQINKSDIVHSHSASILSSNDSLASPRSVFEDKLSKFIFKTKENPIVLIIYYVRSFIENATIKVTLLEARNLKGMNRDKTSDPYCRVRLGKHSVHKTKHIKKNCNPQW